eukprot:scaffold1671_cov344-Pavlova_lutheri.AAC.37
MRSKAFPSGSVPPTLPPVATKWATLLATVFFEVCGTTCMKLSDGFKRPLPTIGVYVFYGISFALFSVTLKQWDVSVAYAVWSGAGTAITAVLGASLFHEKLTKKKVASLALIVAGVVSLNLA